MPSGNPNESGQSGGEVGRVSGVGQLTPEAEQFVDGELQTITQAPMPLIPLEELPKTEAPLPGAAAYPSEYKVTVVTPAAGGGPAIPFTYPIMRINKYSGGAIDWQELIRWDILDGWVGDLHEIAISSSDDTHTKYRFFLANVDQNIPTDRPISTPWTGPWRNNRIPGGFTVRVDIASTDGTLITIDGSLTGSITPIPS